LPFSSQALHDMLGYDGSVFGRQYVGTFKEETRDHQALCYDSSALTARWEPSQLPPGREMRQPKPLFTKLDDSVVEEELARLAG
jgi:methionyl-tRNA synthetase